MLKGGVLMLTDEFPPGPGGIGVYAYELAAGLDRLGVPIRVLCDSREEGPESQAAFDAPLPFPVVRLRCKARAPLAEFRRGREVRRWTAAQAPACLISSGRNAAWLMAPLARSQAIPWIAIGYGSEFREASSRHLRWTQEAFGRAAAVVAISEFTADLIARTGIERAKIRIVHPGADVCRELPNDSDVEALRRRLDLSGRRVILTVGRVSRRKAQDVVIRAMPEILRAVPDALYVVAGIPAQREEFERVARALGVADRVRFLGVAPAQDLPLLYRIADLFILNSRLDKRGNCEGFGIALVEAALACRPTVATRGCGAQEAVEDDVTGILVEPDAPDRTARAAIRILRDPALAERLGADGRRRALEEFSWDRAALQMRDLLAPLCRLAESGASGKPQALSSDQHPHLYGSPQRLDPLRRFRRAARQTWKDSRDRAEFLAWKITHRRGAFIFNGARHAYFWHPYNVTWKNERAVELALALPAVIAATRAGGAVLEVGNVLSRYGACGHVVVDKYDASPGVRNDDILDYDPPPGGFDLVVSISTLEHVGWNEDPRQPQKIWPALEWLKTVCLAPGGRLLATVPLGFNPEVDRAVREGQPLFQEQFYLRRVTAGNAWVQCDRRDVAGAKYGSPYPWANALLVGVHARPR